MEILIASVVGMIVLAGLFHVEISQFKISQYVRERAGLSAPARFEAVLALSHIRRHLEVADRIVIDAATGRTQIRTPLCPAGVPSPTCFDAPANYRWDQYSLIGNVLLFYEDTPAGGGCMNDEILAREITALGFAFVDAGEQPALGTEPFSPGIEDNNLIEYSLLWDNGTRSHQFRGRVAIRSGAYTKVNASGAAGAGDSGTGLENPAMGSGAPALCP